MLLQCLTQACCIIAIWCKAVLHNYVEKVFIYDVFLFVVLEYISLLICRVVFPHHLEIF